MDIKRINIKVSDAHIAIVHTEGKTDEQINHDIAQAVRRVIDTQKSDQPVVKVEAK